MSEPDTSDPIESPRKESDAHSSLRGAVPKAKRRGYGTSTKKRAAKSPSRFRDPLPFFEPDPSDPYSDITIVVNDKRLYFNKCLLSWHSKVLKEQLADDAGANKGRGQPAKTVANKELKMEHKFDDVVELLAYMDPRLECNLTDQAAMRLAAFAQQYDMIRLRKDCEETLTSSYANMRKNKKTGMMPTETILAYLKPADEFKYEKLLNMCIDDAVENVFVDGKIERMEDDLSYPVQKEILRRKNIKLRQQLSKKTRELEMSETERNERRAEFHPIWRR